MTRKDYVLIAEALRRCKPEIIGLVDLARLEETQWKQCRMEIIDVLARDNPRFDRDRFIAATEA